MTGFLFMKSLFLHILQGGSCRARTSFCFSGHFITKSITNKRFQEFFFHI